MKFTKITCGLLMAGAGLAIASCSSGQPPKGQHVEVAPELTRNKRPATESLARAGGPMDQATTATLQHRQRLEAASQGPERVGTAMIENAPGELHKVKYATRDAAPEDVIRVLVGEYMHRSYVVDPKLNANKQSVTMDVEAEMTNQDMEDLLGAIAVLQGWSIEDRGGTLVIGASANMSKSAMAPLLDSASMAPSERVATRAFRLHHIDAKTAGDAVKELVSEGAKTVISGRTLVISDRVRQLNRLGKLIQALDVPSFDGVEVWTYELKNEKSPEAAKMLTSIGAATLGSASEKDVPVTFLALPRGNRLMVISRDPSAQAMVRQWVEQVDQEPSSNTRQRYLYRIQNVDAVKLGALLKATFSERIEKESDPTAQTTGQSDTLMRLTVDPEEDLLIVYATPKDYSDLLAVLTRIDVPRQQVMLQTVISEVSLSDQLAYGVEYFLQTDVGSKILNLIGKATQLGPTDALATGSAFLIGSDGFAVVKALEQNTDVKIITTPKLFGRDKDTAKFQFGGEVPIVTANIDSSVQQNGNTGIRQDIQYKPTGVILEMQPKINESGDVTLHIKLEIRDVRPTTSSGIESPEFTVRLVDTTAIIPHGATLLLGGIIDARDTRLLGKIPILGDIPIIGLAFQNQNNDKERKELLLAVTPIVVNDAHEAEPLVGQFLASAYGVEAALRAFDGALAPVLANAVQEAAPIESAPHEPPASLEKEPPKSRPEQIPPKPAGTRAALALTRLAAAMPDQESEETQVVALFLSGLTEAALTQRGH